MKSGMRAGLRDCRSPFPAGMFQALDTSRPHTANTANFLWFCRSCYWYLPRAGKDWVEGGYAYSRSVIVQQQWAWSSWVCHNCL